MNSSKNYFAIDRTFMTMMLIALLSGFVFFATNSLDFLITAITYNKFSVSNIAYLLAKSTATIVLPLIFIVPSLKPAGRIKSIKVMFFILAALQLLSLSWVAKFIIDNGFANIFSDSALAAAQTHAVVSNIVYWDTYGWIGILFTIIFSGLCIWAGICFDDTKGKVCATVTIITVFRIVAPLVLDLVTLKGFFSSLWLTNNYVDIVCWILMTLAMFTASRYDETWISLIWDQEIPQNEDEQ